jgi:predicted amidohydrolase YtcJ
VDIFSNLTYFDGRRFVPGEIAVSDGQIVEVSEHVSRAGKRLDLGAAYLSPAYNDCHCHTTMLAESFTQIDVGARACPSIADVLAALRNVDPARPWVIGNGFSQGLVAERRYPTLAELDSVAPERPLYIWDASRHGMTANSKALQIAEIGEKTNDPTAGKIGRDESGKPNGQLFESAMGLVRRKAPKITQTELADALPEAARHLHRMGITAATDLSSFRFGVEVEMGAYEKAVERGMKLRVRLTPLFELLTAIPDWETWDPWRGHPLLSLGGVKLFADGAIGTRTAFISGEYSSGGSGFPIYSQDELNEKVMTIHRSGRQCIIHAIGDQAARMALDAYESALQEDPHPNPPPQAGEGVLAGPQAGEGEKNDATGLPTESQPRSPRHRIEHSMLLDPALILRYSELGICAGVQPEFLLRFGDDYFAALGDRAATIKPLRSLLRAGVPLGFSSDLPIVPGDPGDGMVAAVQRESGSGRQFDLAERITAGEALAAYTSGSAYLNFQENLLGSIRPGCRADFIVFRDDPLEQISEGQHPDIFATFFEGESVWEK